MELDLQNLTRTLDEILSAAQERNNNTTTRRTTTSLQRKSATPPTTQNSPFASASKLNNRRDGNQPFPSAKVSTASAVSSKRKQESSPPPTAPEKKEAPSPPPSRPSVIAPVETEATPMQPLPPAREAVPAGSGSSSANDGLAALLAQPAAGPHTRRPKYEVLPCKVVDSVGIGAAQVVVRPRAGDDRSASYAVGDEGALVFPRKSWMVNLAMTPPTPFLTLHAPVLARVGRLAAPPAVCLMLLLDGDDEAAVHITVEAAAEAGGDFAPVPSQRWREDVVTQLRVPGDAVQPFLRVRLQPTDKRRILHVAAVVLCACEEQTSAGAMTRSSTASVKDSNHSGTGAPFSSPQNEESDAKKKKSKRSVAVKEEEEDNEAPLEQMPGTSSSDRAPSTASRLAAVPFWDAVEHWQLKDALSFCLQKSLAFSVSVCTLGGTAPLASSLVLPYGFHILAALPESSGGSSSGNAPRARVLLDSLVQLTSSLRAKGYNVELAFRVDNGFCCALRPTTSTAVDGEGQSALKWLLVLTCESGAKVADVLSTGLACHRASAASEAEEETLVCGRLNVVVDFVGVFAVLTEVLRQWACECRTHLLYYGKASCFPFEPFLDEEDAEYGAVLQQQQHDSGFHDRYATPALSQICWSGFAVHAKKLRDAQLADMVVVHLRLHTGAVLVWQPCTSAPRVVVTELHLLQCLARLDGVCTTPSTGSVLRSCFGLCAEEVDKIEIVNDQPWRELTERIAEVQAAKASAPMGSLIAGGSDQLQFSALHAHQQRVTRSFAFHLLDVALKKEWSVVGLTIPSYLYTNADGKFPSTALSLDDDVFLDTIFKWNYAFPRVVVLFYDRKVKRGPVQDACCTEASSPAFTPFTERSLESFVAAPSFENAVNHRY